MSDGGKLLAVKLHMDSCRFLVEARDDETLYDAIVRKLQSKKDINCDTPNVEVAACKAWYELPSEQKHDWDQWRNGFDKGFRACWELLKGGAQRERQPLPVTSVVSSFSRNTRQIACHLISVSDVSQSISRNAD